MRSLLAAAAVAAGLLVPLGASPAEATATCTPPAMPYFTVDLINVHLVDCDTARVVARHAIHHGAPAGWTCHSTYSGLIQHLGCHLTAHPHHTVRFNFRAAF